MLDHQAITMYNIEKTQGAAFGLSVTRSFHRGNLPERKNQWGGSCYFRGSISDVVWCLRSLAGSFYPFSNGLQGRNDSLPPPVDFHTPP